MVRPRKDAARQELLGTTHRATKKSKTESQSVLPIVSVHEVTMPDWLIPEAVAVWQKHAPMLIGNNLLASIDAEMYGRFCQLVGTAEKCERIIKEDGMYINRGSIKHERPEVKTADRCWKDAGKLGPQFGIMMSSRSAKGVMLRPVAIGGGDSANAGSGVAQSKRDSLLNRKRS